MNNKNVYKIIFKNYHYYSILKSKNGKYHLSMYYAYAEDSPKLFVNDISLYQLLQIVIKDKGFDLLSDDIGNLLAEHFDPNARNVY